VVTIAALGAGQWILDRTARAQSAGAQAPTFQVDPLWPKPLPNHWIIGSTIGVSVDAQDHVWIIHRPDTLVPNETGAANNPPTASCCFPAPPVLEFDQAGNLVGHWGGPGQGYEWPQSNHGITVDYKGNVWIGGNGQKDAQVLKFTRQGKFLLQIGHFDKSRGSLDTENLHQAAKIFVDPSTNEAYIADGYGNHRVIVFDAETGAYKRHWGAYGEKPDDAAARGRFDPNGPPPKQFGSAVHCLRLSRDGIVYACDRSNNRFQMFRKDGSFVKEVFISKETQGATVWDIEFSPDQRFMYVADGGNQKIWILQRDTQQVLGSFGGPGKEAGSFATSLHDIVVDSKGNLYTGEAATGGRVQKFRVKS
jgi:DNA-binding beta-propeller fold protein YncE